MTICPAIRGVAAQVLHRCGHLAWYEKDTID